MTRKVLFLIPRDSMDDEERLYYRKIYPDVLFELSDSFDPIPLVRRKLDEGVEIIAGRGNTAMSVRENFPQVHVVQIQATGYDIIRSLRQINLANATVAVITNNVDVSGLKMFEKLFSIRIISYLRLPFTKIDSAIRDADMNGAQYILGGALTCRMVKELGVSAQPIPLALGPESMSCVMHEIQQVQETINVESARQRFLNHLLDSIDEGVVSVDRSGIITLVNANAAKMLQVPSHMAIGKAINRFFSDPLPDGANSLVTINGNRLLVTHTPVQHDGQEYCDIYTLHEPAHIETLETHIRREAHDRNSHLARFHFDDFIGASASLQEAIRISKNYARTDASILLVGETGSGKEMFAQSIHNASSRRKGTFVAVNCAALPESLLESELFGYVEGAFTGANRKGRAGLFETAHGGTIFLDEISETSYASQGRLLRVLQEKYIVRLGNHKIVPVDVRVIAATNRNLHELVEQGKFREDLFYRLNVLNLNIPPLRDRAGDAVLLMQFFLKNAGTDMRIEADAAEFLNTYQWRGNVREVSNLAERIVAISTGQTVSLQQIERLLDPQGLSLPHQNNEVAHSRLREKRQEEEIADALLKTEGNLGKAAAMLDIDRSTLWRRMKRLNIQPSRQ
jgi:transcriptional regulator with PAS, ATPase and Fis domain